MGLFSNLFGGSRGGRSNSGYSTYKTKSGFAPLGFIALGQQQSDNV